MPKFIRIFTAVLTIGLLVYAFSGGLLRLWLVGLAATAVFYIGWVTAAYWELPSREDTP